MKKRSNGEKDSLPSLENYGKKRGRIKQGETSSTRELCMHYTVQGNAQIVQGKEELAVNP